jgi:hypothetical protein
MKQLLVAGSLTGLFGDNEPEFQKASAQLKQLGYVAVTPFEIAREAGLAAGGNASERRQLLLATIARLAECDGVVALTGWKSDKFSRALVSVGDALGVRADPIEAWLLAGF